MDSKEVKQALKDAREAIRQKEFKAALKHCKSALKVDKECYMAWVFVGAAAQEIDQLEQSVAAFKKACGISPDQILAWQGLCALYEKHQSLGDFENDRHSVYMKLIELTQNDATKQVEIADKLTSHYRNSGNVGKYLSTLEECVKIIGAKPETTKLWKSLVDFSTNKLVTYPKNHQELLVKAYAHLAFSSETERPRRDALCRSYVDALCKTGHRDDVIPEALRFGESFPESSVPMEVISGMYVDMTLSSWEEPKPSAEIDKIEELTKSRPNLQVGWLAKATHLYASGNPNDALEALAKAVEVGRSSREASLLLSLCSLKTHNFRKAEVHAQNGLSLSSGVSDWMSQKLLLCLAESLCAQQCHEEASAALQKIGEEHAKQPTVLWCLFETALQSGNFDKAEEVLSTLQEIAFESSRMKSAHARLLIHREKIAEAQEILTSLEDKSPEATHLLALTHWKLGQHDEAMPIFLEAARLDPEDYRNFLYLGRHYFYHLKDVQKAVRCFQKAFQLNRASEEAGSLLSDALCDLGQHEQNVKFLEAITSQLPVKRAKWAWLRLGLQQLRLGSATEAVQSLQNSLRADPSDKSCWECLGEAYLMRESLGAALLCFKKCLDADPKDLFSLYETANIKSRQGLYKEAADNFEEALDVNPEYVPAIKGLAEARLALAREHLEQGLCGLGLDDCQQALDAVARALALQGRLVCLWKLAGDICLVPAVYGINWASLKLPTSLLQGEQDSGQEQLIKASQKCYMTAIRMKPRLASLWHDLGLALWLEARLQKGSFDRALASVRNAVTLKPSCFAYWNSLGVLAVTSGAENYGLAQHCFIKSLELESNNLYAWTNLGALYLQAGNVQLAHQAFAKAQSVEPTAMRPWIGQAFIAEKVQHHDTVDLFRHCVGLGNHGDAARAYANFLCKESGPTVAQKHGRDILVAASDALSRTVDLEGALDPAALNMLGILLERQGLLRSARDAYKKALTLPGQSDENINCIRVNLARVLCPLRCYEEAIQLCQQTGSRSKDVLCILGFCYGKLGESSEALKVYEEALSKSPLEKKGEVELGMAMVALKASGAAAAKDFLQNRLSSMPQSREALEALCCLSLLAGDSSACRSSTQKLMTLSKKGVALHERTASLLCCQQFMKGTDARQACRILSSAVHLHPDKGSLWSALTQALLLEKRPSALCCALAGLVLGERSPRHMAMIVLARLMQGKAKEALRAAQKMVYLYPDSHSGWVLLGLAISECQVVADKALQHDRFLLGADTLWKLWSNLVQVQYACVHHRWQKVSELVPLVLWGFAGSPLVSKLLNVLQAISELLMKTSRLEKASLSSIQDTVESEDIATGWQMLSKLQQRTEDYSGAIESLERAKKYDGMAGKILELELCQAWLALRSAKVDSQQRERMLKAALGYLNTALRTNPRCRAGHMVLGVWALENDNPRLAKKSLERVMRFHDGGSSWIQSSTVKLLFLHYLEKKDADALKKLLPQVEEQLDLQSLLSEENREQLISMGVLFNASELKKH
uniref:Superkiller protein 3 n=1 Tax=Rhipicephalus appendiculatus TaxID=34631 RepID=A0A131YK66_RHIAP